MHQELASHRVQEAGEVPLAERGVAVYEVVHVLKRASGDAPFLEERSELVPVPFSGKALDRGVDLSFVDPTALVGGIFGSPKRL